MRRLTPDGAPLILKLPGEVEQFRVGRVELGGGVPVAGLPRAVADLRHAQGAVLLEPVQKLHLRNNDAR